jgi:pre-mRNA-splicing factor 18
LDGKKRRRDDGDLTHHDGNDDNGTNGQRNEDQPTADKKKKETGSRTESKSKSTQKNQTNSNSTANTKMTAEEITNALRELGIPIHLFGERNDQQRFTRLQEARDSKKALMAGISENEDFKLGSGHGIRNPFLERNKDKKDKVGDDGNGDYKSKSKSKTIGWADGTGAGDGTRAGETGTGSGSGSGETGKEATQDLEEILDDDSDPHKAIHRFLKAQLKAWEEDLYNRPDAVKRTLLGKTETKTLKQCKDYIRPLFKQCKNRRLEEDLTNNLLKIVKFCKEGEFVKANDAYIDVAIGRAAWPIGVTMVGIHARSGRAKIESSNVAHVMNSEMQRKYLTSVKRLITYCQKKRVDVAPSKKVVN